MSAKKGHICLDNTKIKISIANKGKNNGMYKTGFYCKDKKCQDCGKSCDRGAIRCKSCSEHFNKLGEKNPGYRKQGSKRSNNGYVFIKINNLWITEHRYKVERYIGYKVNKKWIIHHIDGSRNNNKLNNLYIFTKKGIHSSFETLVHTDIIKRNILISNLKNFKRR